ncbi:MAG: hypothetical protein WDN30_16040 [Pararobbsia sp.]
MARVSKLFEGSRVAQNAVRLRDRQAARGTARKAALNKAPAKKSFSSCAEPDILLASVAAGNYAAKQ